MHLTKEQKDLLRTIVGVYNEGCRSEFFVLRTYGTSYLVYPGHAKVEITADDSDFRQLDAQDLITSWRDSKGTLHGKPAASGIGLVTANFGEGTHGDAISPTPSLDEALSTGNEQQPRRLRAFLCHASGDKPEVRKLYDFLVNSGINAWLDEEKLLPGQDWQAEIRRAVRESDVVIVCLSDQAATKAGFVQKEIKFALDAADEQPEGAIYLIPIKLEECKVPERLSRWQWVDLFTSDGHDKLMRALRERARTLGVTVGELPRAAGLTENHVSKDVSFQLFNERKEVYEKVMAFLARVEQTGKPPEHHKLNQYLKDTKDAELLFATDVVDFIQEVYRKAAKFKALHDVWEPMEPGTLRQEKYPDVQKAEEALHECWVRACTPDSDPFTGYLKLGSGSIEPSRPGDREAQLRAFAGKRRIVRVSPLVPPIQHNQFIVCEATSETVRLEKHGTGHSVAIPKSRVADLLVTGDDEPPTLILEGRLQWITLQEKWRFFPEKPPTDDPYRLGVRRASRLRGTRADAISDLLKNGGWEPAWKRTENIDEFVARGGEVYYNDDGHFLFDGNLVLCVKRPSKE